MPFKVLVLSCLVLSLYAQDKQNETIVPAEYPGGMEALYKFIGSNLKYPLNARIKGIEGNVFLEFIVDEQGYLKSESIKVVRGINTECDQEAIRVIKLCNSKWTPGHQNNKPVPSTLRLAIIFKLEPNFDTNFNFTVLDKPFTGVVKPKSGTKPNWPLYGDAEMKIKIGTVSPGDSVLIDGWAPWVFHTTGSHDGFIAFRSVVVPNEFSNLIELIETESSRLIREKEKLDSAKNAIWKPLLELSENDKEQSSDEEELLQEPYTFLKLSASKKDIVVGECTIVDLSFYVDSRNKLSLQFTDVGLQLATIHKNQLNKENYWQASTDIRNIEAKHITSGDRNFTVFQIYEAAYCPSELSDLQFQPVSIQFLSFKFLNNQPYQKVFDKKISYTTKPLTVKVHPLNANLKPTEADFYKLVGKFKITETYETDAITTGNPIRYSVCLEGNGLTFPLAPPVLVNDNFSSKFLYTNHTDTIIRSNYLSRSTYTYEITFNQPGEIRMDQDIFKAYYTVTKEVYPLKTQSSATVTNASNNLVADQTTMDARSKILAIDISQSMMIEDYEPNRLAFVKDVLKEFLSKRKECDTDLVLFAGQSSLYNISTPDSCYAESLINGIDFNQSKGLGTAIGDAIWNSINHQTYSQKTKRLIVIGDGENTSGITSLGLAIKLARKRNIAVYAIGVGHYGEVKFGNDLYGNPNLIPQTFSDVDLKRIATQTGGKYFWADTKANFIKALNTIYSTP